MRIQFILASQARQVSASSEPQIYEDHLSSVFLIHHRVSLSDNKDMCSPTLVFHTSNEIPTNESAVDLVSEAVLLARSIMAEVGEVEEVLRELVTKTELDLGEGEDWARIEEGRGDVAATEFDLRL